MTPEPQTSAPVPVSPPAGDRSGTRADGTGASAFPPRALAKTSRPLPSTRPRGAAAGDQTSLSPPSVAERAATETPGPATGEADPGIHVHVSPGRARAPGLAGGAPSGSSVLSAGTAAATGREAYEQARRKAQRRRPADPQQAPSGPGAPARVAALMVPCATVLPEGGVCGATGYEHAIGTRAGAEVRTGCSIATDAGPCECRAYAPGGAA